MEPPVKQLNDWLEAMKKSASEFAQTTLGLPGIVVSPESDSLSWEDTIGAYVPWVSDDQSVQIGLITTPENCYQLARSLLGLTENDELTEEDMADAVREIVNILAGMSKSIIGGNVSASNMGLPVFINGYILLTKTQRSSSELIRLGNISCYLFVLQEK
jgi:Chemotaxis phosphatase CheX